jgi:hypothetical protein
MINGFCNSCTCGAREVVLYSVIMGMAITFQLVSKPGTFSDVGQSCGFEIVEI